MGHASCCQTGIGEACRFKARQARCETTLPASRNTYRCMRHMTLRRTALTTPDNSASRLFIGERSAGNGMRLVCVPNSANQTRAAWRSQCLAS